MAWVQFYQMILILPLSSKVTNSHGCILNMKKIKFKPGSAVISEWDALEFITDTKISPHWGINLNGHFFPLYNLLMLTPPPFFFFFFTVVMLFTRLALVIKEVHKTSTHTLNGRQRNSKSTGNIQQMSDNVKTIKQKRYKNKHQTHKHAQQVRF